MLYLCECITCRNLNALLTRKKNASNLLLLVKVDVLQEVGIYYLAFHVNIEINCYSYC